MIKAKRLEALEADTLTAWRSAWEQNAVSFKRHTNGLSLDSTELIQTLETEHPHLSDDDVERACKEFLRSINISSFDAFSAWFKSYEVPDFDDARPDLSMWPSDVPNPPDEQPGEWSTVLLYANSEDVIERLAAKVYLFVLAAARTAREG